MIEWQQAQIESYGPVNLSGRAPIDLWVGGFADFSEEIEHLKALLSEQELERADRFKRPSDRVAFIIRRAVLRQILSSYLDVQPENTAYKEESNLKPTLCSNDKSQEIYFNTSYCEKYFLIAVSGFEHVGIDIEVCVRDENLKLVADEHFTEAELILLSQSEPDNWYKMFTQIWTRKEALLKAVGKGLSWSLAKIETGMEATSQFLGECASREEAQGTWFLQTGQVDEDHFLSIARRDQPVQCNFLRLVAKSA